MKRLLKRVVPRGTWEALRSVRRRAIRGGRQLFEAMGYRVALKSDYYSTLPLQSELERNEHRWNRPSAMAGVSFDIDEYKRRLEQLFRQYGDEFRSLPPYSENVALGFGPGYTELDALLLYAMVRDTKPRRYFEVGSGLSTYYCSLAAARNAKEGHSLQMLCIEPFPYARLRSIPGIEIVKDEVQNVACEVFLQLEDNDIFFIDSSHALRIDSDVPFLFLEVLPQLRKGVRIHLHDIPFPYNIPYPPEHWVLGRSRESPYWPVYWNEAMLLQAFLAFNTGFKIEMSAPMIRHFDEPFLAKIVPEYKSVQQQPNTFSSIWIRKTV